MKLLVVEDDALFAQTVMRRLSDDFGECFHALNLADALKLAEQHDISHVLLDMHLGVESGLLIIEQLRALLPEAKIVLLTGFASIATAVKAMKLGADDYLAKPASLALIQAALLGKSQAQSEQEPQSTQVMSPERLEWEHIQTVLARNNGNISETARQLNMHRRTLQRKLQKKPVQK